MELYATAGNPVPSNAQVYPLTTSDGVTLRVARWRPTARRSVGSVLLVQGRSEFIEKYFETIADLRRRGFHVITFDLRGQGASGRMLDDPRKGHVDSFDEYVAEIRLLITEQLARLPSPHFGLAHSMGAAALLLALETGETRLDRAALLSPLVGLTDMKLPLAAETLAYGLDFMALGTRYIPGGGATPLSTRPFAGNKLSSDPIRYGRVSSILSEQPQLAIGDPTIRWVLSMFQTFRRFGDRDFGRNVRTPTLMLIPGADPLCDPYASEELATRIRGCQAIVIPGARHELLMESDAIRSQTMSALSAFLPGEAVEPTADIKTDAPEQPSEG